MTDTGTITRTPGTETAVLAGGCFWGMEDLIRRQPGVLATRVGYTGGQNAHATYRNHPGHAEAVEIVFDPAVDHVPRHPGVLLPDPRPVDAQPPGQRHRLELPLGDLPAVRRSRTAVARDTIADVDASGLWPAKAVTTIEPEGPFWEAEPEHQDYLLKYPERLHVPLPARGLGAPASAPTRTRSGRRWRRPSRPGRLGARGSPCNWTSPRSTPRRPGDLLRSRGGASRPEPAFTRCYGWAHRAHGIRTTRDTRFAVASGSKMFTALAIMRLVEDGALSLRRGCATSSARISRSSTTR